MVTPKNSERSENEVHFIVKSVTNLPNNISRIRVKFGQHSLNYKTNYEDVASGACTLDSSAVLKLKSMENIKIKICSDKGNFKAYSCLRITQIGEMDSCPLKLPCFSKDFNDTSELNRQKDSLPVSVEVIACGRVNVFALKQAKKPLSGSYANWMFSFGDDHSSENATYDVSTLKYNSLKKGSFKSLNDISEEAALPPHHIKSNQQQQQLVTNPDSSDHKMRSPSVEFVSPQSLAAFSTSTSHRPQQQQQQQQQQFNASPQLSAQHRPMNRAHPATSFDELAEFGNQLDGNGDAALDYHVQKGMCIVDELDDSASGLTESNLLSISQHGVATGFGQNQHRRRNSHDEADAGHCARCTKIERELASCTQRIRDLERTNVSLSAEYQSLVQRMVEIGHAMLQNDQKRAKGISRE